MGTIDPQIPDLGGETTTEDPKIVSALTTIRDLVNGEIDNDNIAADADIVGSKFLTGSIPLGKLAADIGAGELKIVTAQAEGTPGPTASSVNICQTGSLVPGTYFVLGTFVNVGTTVLVPFGGSVTLDQFTTTPSVTGAPGSVHGILTVTTATVLVLNSVSAGSSASGSLTVFGIAT